MEEFDFSLEVRGKIRAYNQEHADKLSQEYSRDITKYTWGNVSGERINVSVGSKVTPFYIQEDELYQMIKKRVYTVIKETLEQSLSDLRDSLPSTPIIFDKTDYNLVRERLKARFDYYLSEREGMFYSQPPEGTNSIESLAKLASLEITKDCTEYLLHQIAGTRRLDGNGE